MWPCTALLRKRSSQDMACHGAAIIPLLFSVLILLQGIVQFGVYIYFRHLSTPPHFFAFTNCPSFAGGCDFFTGLSLIFIFLNDTKRKWRWTRLISSVLFAFIVAVQSINWALCEIFEFRLRLNVDDSYRIGDKRNRLIRAYLSSLSASVLGVTIGWCGLFYVFVIYYRLGNVLFNSEITGRVGDKTRDQQRNAGFTSTPMTPRASQTAKSWEYHRHRSSTPKSKGLRRLHFKKKRESDLDSISSIHRSRGPLEISDEEFNRSAPLRLIAMINPNAVAFKNAAGFEELQSPTLEECFSPKTNPNRKSNEMSTFFDEDQTQKLVDVGHGRQKSSIDPIIHWPPPPPPADCTIVEFDSAKGSKTKPKFVLPEAWRLPVFPQPLAKVLDFSEMENNDKIDEGIEISRASQKNATSSFIVNHL